MISKYIIWKISYLFCWFIDWKLCNKILTDQAIYEILTPDYWTRALNLQIIITILDIWMICYLNGWGTSNKLQNVSNLILLISYTTTWHYSMTLHIIQHHSTLSFVPLRVNLWFIYLLFLIAIQWLYLCSKCWKFYTMKVALSIYQESPYFYPVI